MPLSRRQRQAARDRWEFYTHFLLWSHWCVGQAEVMRYMYGLPRAPLRMLFSPAGTFPAAAEESATGRPVPSKVIRRLRVLADRMPGTKELLVERSQRRKLPRR